MPTASLDFEETMPKILFSDEKHFTVYKVVNSRTDRYITNKHVQDVPETVRTTQKSKHPAQLMVSTPSSIKLGV